MPFKLTVPGKKRYPSRNQIFCFTSCVLRCFSTRMTHFSNDTINSIQNSIFRSDVISVGDG